MTTALARRLAKLEEAIQPASTAPDGTRPGIDWGATLERIKADGDRIAALPPLQRIGHELDCIARASLPTEDTGSVAGLRAKLQALEQSRIPERQQTIREFELKLLAQTGYVPDDLPDAPHPLPPAARAFIDNLLFDA